MPPLGGPKRGVQFGFHAPSTCILSRYWSATQAETALLAAVFPALFLCQDDCKVACCVLEEGAVQVTAATEGIMAAAFDLISQRLLSLGDKGVNLF